MILKKLKYDNYHFEQINYLIINRLIVFNNFRINNLKEEFYQIHNFQGLKFFFAYSFRYICHIKLLLWKNVSRYLIC